MTTGHRVETKEFLTKGPMLCRQKAAKRKTTKTDVTTILRYRGIAVTLYATNAQLYINPLSIYKCPRPP